MLEFKAQFVDAVESGRKTQIILSYHKKGNPVVGKKVQLYSGMTSPKARRLGVGTVISIKKVNIHPKNVFIDDVILSEPKATELARANGFESVEEMALFFEKRCKKLPFTGQLIKWRLDG